MNSKKNTYSNISKKNWKYYLFPAIYLPILLIQIVFCILFFYGLRSIVLFWTGIVMIMLFFLFGWLPIRTLKVEGGAEGKSFAETTKLVKSGLYHYIRHPQFLSWVFLSIGLACLSQFWVTAILTLPLILFVYMDAYMQDKYLIEKFGGEYKDYMEEVPRINPLMKLFK